MPDQASVSVENKNTELGRDRRDAELRDRFAVEIRDDVNIVARVSVNVALRICLLDVFRFRVEAMPNNGGNHSAQRRQDVLLKIHECNQTDFWIAQSYLGNAIANGLCFRFIAAVDDRNDRDVAVGSEKLVPIDVGEDERISIPRMQLDCLRAGDDEEQREEKTLRPPQDRA